MVVKEKEEYICPVCGNDHTVRHGYNVTKQGRFPRRKCLKCGSTFYEQSAIKITIGNIPTVSKGKKKQGGIHG